MHDTLRHDPPREPAPPAELGGLLARLRDGLWRYLCTLGADAATADDLVQEAILVVLRRPEFRAEAPAAVFAFLRTTARQLWQRRGPRGVTLQQLDEADAVWQQRCGDGVGGDYVDALRHCVEALPARSRALLDAVYRDGDGREAAGTALGIGAHGVKSALRRLRAALFDCIQRRLGGSR